MYDIIHIKNIRYAATTAYLFVFLCSSHAIRAADTEHKTHQLPSIVMQFYDVINTHNNIDKMSHILAQPIIIHETAYEIGNGWCAKHVRNTTIHNIKQYSTTLQRLTQALKNQKITKLDDNIYGVASLDDCEHIWAVTLNSDASKIIALTLDAENNLWSHDRIDFD